MKGAGPLSDGNYRKNSDFSQHSGRLFIEADSRRSSPMRRSYSQPRSSYTHSRTPPSRKIVEQEFLLSAKKYPRRWLFGHFLSVDDRSRPISTPISTDFLRPRRVRDLSLPTQCLRVALRTYTLCSLTSYATSVWKMSRRSLSFAAALNLLADTESRKVRRDKDTVALLRSDNFLFAGHLESRR